MEDEFVELNFCVLSSGIVINEIESSGLEFCSYFFLKTRQEHMKDKSERVGKISHSVLLYLLHLLGNTSLRLDVLVSPNSAYAGGGGFIRDSNGSWVRVFSRAIETSFIVSSFWQNFVLYEMAYLWQNFLGLKSSLSM